jgi:hypothetical protein
MLGKIIIILLIFTSQNVKSQALSFDKALNKLFFDVDLNSSPDSLFDSLMKIGDLHHSDTVTCQWSLPISLQLGTARDAKACRHKFTFIKSPILNLKIDTGHIEITIGEAPGTKKIIGLDWYLTFKTKKDAKLYFDKLREIFNSVSTIKKFNYDKLNKGYIAQLSTRNSNDKSIKDISLFLNKSKDKKKYKISLLLANQFTGQ